MIIEKMSDKSASSKKDASPQGTSARDVSSGGSVGSKIVTVMCCRSKCVGNPKVVVKR